MTTVIFLQVWSYVHMKPGYFASRSGNSKDNIFHINTSSRDEKRPILINFFTYNNKRHACFFNILKNQPTRAAWKKILSKFTNILKSICTWIHSSNFQWGIASILLATKQCIQNIAYNLREGDCKKSFAWLLFW